VVSDMSRRFRVEEVAPSDLDAAEQAALAGVAQELERVAAGDVTPTPDFADRVMTAVSAEPDPMPTAAAGRAVRLGRPAAVVAAIGDAWRVVLDARRPLALRARAGALVLVAAIGGVSVAGVAVAGAASLLVPPVTPEVVASPSAAAPTSPSPSRIVSPSPTATDEASPGPSEEPSESPEASGSPEPSPKPTATRQPSTPAPTRTAQPTSSPEDSHGPGPSQTPEETHWPYGSPTPTPEPTSSGD
jgi:hypothetical protein